MKREELLQLYREEKDPSVKDRLMLIIKGIIYNSEHIYINNAYTKV